MRRSGLPPGGPGSRYALNISALSLSLIEFQKVSSISRLLSGSEMSLVRLFSNRPLAKAAKAPLGYRFR